MIEIAARLKPRGAHRRRAAVLLAAAFVGLLVALAVIVAPHAFDARLIGAEVAGQLRATAGLEVETRGRMRFTLLPTPHILAQGVEVLDPTHTLTMRADELRGTVRLLPLLVGRVELTTVTLRHPELTIDLDGRPMPPDSTIGRVLRAPPSEDTIESRPLGSVTFVDGTVRILSRRWSRTVVLTRANATVDWPDVESPATLTGAVDVEGTTADVALWLAQPALLLRGGHTATTLTIHAAPLELAANGNLGLALAASFRGHLSASSPSGADLLALARAAAPPPARLANLSLTSDVVASLAHDGQTAIDLPNLVLRADENDYEGTLSIQTGAAKPLVAGTLASNQLSLAPFLNAMPTVTEAGHHWSTRPLPSSGDGPVDLDFRISANHLRLGPFSVDDAALGVITRGDRTEIGLIESRAYGGTFKGRVSVGGAAAGVDLRGTGAFDGVDLATVGWDAFGRQIAAGHATGAYAFEAAGASVAALVGSLSGSARLSVGDGELSTLDLAHVLDPSRTGASSGRTPFTHADIDLRFARGEAQIESGALDGPGGRLMLGGSVGLAKRDLDVRIGAPNSPGGAQPLATIRGAWDDPRLMVQSR